MSMTSAVQNAMPARKRLNHRSPLSIDVPSAWYFRNALVRANYADYAREVVRDWRYLEMFFRNLLLGEHDEMKSRYLLIGLTDDDKRKIRELTEGKGVRKKTTRKSGNKTTQKSIQKTTRKSPRETTQKTAWKTARKNGGAILDILRRNPHSTRQDIAAETGLTPDGVKWNLRQLKAAGRLRRVGPDKGGHWEVVEK